MNAAGRDCSSRGCPSCSSSPSSPPSVCRKPVLEQSDHSRSSYLGSQFSLLSRCFDETEASDAEIEHGSLQQRCAAFYLSQVLGEMSIDKVVSTDSLDSNSSVLESTSSIPSLSSIPGDSTLLQEQNSCNGLDDSITSIDVESTTTPYREERITISPYEKRSCVLVMDPCAGKDKCLRAAQEKRNLFEKKELRWFAESSESRWSSCNGNALSSPQMKRGTTIPKQHPSSKDASPRLVRRARTPSFDLSS